jgi:hypothetical protein
MATTLYLRSSTTAQSDTGTAYEDVLATAGSAATTKTANTTASGTEIILGSWITGRLPAGGIANIGAITLNLYGFESNLNANCTFGARFYKRTAAGVETELLSTGRVNDNVEFPATSVSLMNWVYTPNQNRTFAENDRIVVKLYASNFGTMASGRVVTLNYDSGTGTPSGSNIVLTETIAFKAEPAPLTRTYVKQAGTWKPATSFVKTAGTWKPATPFVKTAGTWKQA